MRTITRIPRNRYSRAKRDEPISRRLSYQNIDKGKGKEALFPDPGPTHMPSFAMGSHMLHQPTPRTFATSRFIEPPYAPEPIERQWTPTPMSIDPRSADFRHASWPRPLIPYGNHPYQAWPVQGAFTSLMDIQEEPGPSHPFIPLRATTPYPSTSLHLPSAPPNRGPAIVPIAKACHNFLLARRVQSAKRRRLAAEHHRQITEQNLIPPHQMTRAISSPPLPGPRKPLPTLARGAIRDLALLATVDESRPPRKRRRSLSPDSASDTPHRTPRVFTNPLQSGNSPLLLPAHIFPPGNLMPAIPDSPSFSAILDAANHTGRQSAEEEREERRAAWLQGEHMRAAVAGNAQDHRGRRTKVYKGTGRKGSR